VAIIITVTLSLPLSLFFFSFFARTVFGLTVSEKMYIMDSMMDMMYTYDRTVQYDAKTKSLICLLLFFPL
jgi:hypothetical protein